uniref:Immunoglobulin domain-containing protein n=1 Tax=Salvator merianae TaxID=96440 RepID=A0A8D0BKL3_SALMN
MSNKLSLARSEGYSPTPQYCFHLEVLSLQGVKEKEGYLLLLPYGSVLCQKELYTLKAPDSVSVQKDLCVVIPCRFTYDTSKGKQQPYGYWYEKGRQDSEPAVATNNKSKIIEGFARDRFHLVGDVEQNNCSLVIDRACMNDAKQYYFRFENRFVKYSYRKKYVKVNVTGEYLPDSFLLLFHPGPFWGDGSTPGSCSWAPASIIWEGAPENVTSTAELRNGVYRSVLNFVPSATDHGKNITCKVIYGKVQSAFNVTKTVQLIVSYQGALCHFARHLLLWKWAAAGYLAKTVLASTFRVPEWAICKADSPLLRLPVTWLILRQITQSSPRLAQHGMGRQMLCRSSHSFSLSTIAPLLALLQLW